jgi:hypothetical protein
MIRLIAHKVFNSAPKGGCLFVWVQAKWTFGGDKTKKRTKIGDLPQFITRKLCFVYASASYSFPRMVRKQQLAPTPCRFKRGTSHLHRHDTLSHSTYFNDRRP